MKVAADVGLAPVVVVPEPALNQKALVVSQLPVPPAPPMFELTSQKIFAALARGETPTDSTAAATIKEARERVERCGVGTGAVFEKPTRRILLLETET